MIARVETPAGEQGHVARDHRRPPRSCSRTAASTRCWVPGRCAGPSSARSRTRCRRRSSTASITAGQIIVVDVDDAEGAAQKFTFRGEAKPIDLPDTPPVALSGAEGATDEEGPAAAEAEVGPHHVRRAVSRTGRRPFVVARRISATSPSSTCESGRCSDGRSRRRQAEEAVGPSARRGRRRAGVQAAGALDGVVPGRVQLGGGHRVVGAPGRTSSSRPRTCRSVPANFCTRRGGPSAGG